MGDQSERNREPWADFVRVVAIFSVVWLHSAAPWVYRYGQVSGFNWQIANIADSVVRVSVPLFFMLTGYLLLNKPVTLGFYFRRRLSRILIPWIAWSFVYLAYGTFHDGYSMGIVGALRAFVNGDIYYHLWFLYTLIGLYLSIPIISWLTGADRQKRSLYFLVLWFVAASLFPFLKAAASYATQTKVQSAFDLSMFAGYSGYLVAGALMGASKISRSRLALFLGGYGLAVVFTIVATTLATGRSQSFQVYFYGYATPNVVVAAVAAFAFLKGLGTAVCRNPRVSYVFERISHTTLGIYLIHPVALNLIYDGKLGSFLASASKNSAVSIPLVSVIAFFLSYVAGEIILRVPVVRRIV